MNETRRNHAFTLVELLVSMAILALLLIGLTSLLNMTMRTYTGAAGKIEAFDAARTAFETMTRTLQQATLLSYLGYDDPKDPTKFQLKSDLHYISGLQTDLSLSLPGTASTHAVFFQAPLGLADASSLQTATTLLNTVGFFLSYGDDPDRPAIIRDLTPQRFRYRLFEYLPPREKMTVYENTISSVGGIPTSNETYSGTDWLNNDVNILKNCKVLSENVIALAILPVTQDQSVPPTYLWNSRTSSNQLPRALKIVMAVLDEASAARLNTTSTPPNLVPPGLFTVPSQFEADAIELERILAAHSPPLNYHIFRTEVALPIANANP